MRKRSVVRHRIDISNQAIGKVKSLLNQPFMPNCYLHKNSIVKKCLFCGYEGLFAFVENTCADEICHGEQCGHGLLTCPICHDNKRDMVHVISRIRSILEGVNV